MSKQNNIYVDQQLYNFEFDSIGNEYEIQVDLSPITILYNTASDDNILNNESNEKTPLGINEKEKKDIIKIFEWFEIAKIFKNGALKSFQDKSFKNYKKQNPWYLLACEQEQIVNLIIEMDENNKIIKNDYKYLINPNLSLRDNYDKLISNSCFEEASLELFNWMKTKKEYNKYINIYENICLEKIENDVNENLIFQYKKMAKMNIECGGIYFDRYSANKGNADAFGIHFHYETPIKDIIF